MSHLDLDTHVQEVRIFQSRAMAAMIFVLLLIAALLSRLTYLQLTQHEHFATRSDDNRLKLVAVPPTRGLIYDRNGVLLAENRPSYGLEITPEQVKNLPETLDRLAEVIEIREADMRRFEKLRRRKPSFEGIPIRFHLTDEEVARFAVNRHHFPGVDIQARLSRFYPAGNELVHVVGYVGRIDERELQRVDQANYAGTSHIGKVGVEAAYEDALHGTVGHRRVEINASGRVVKVIEEESSIPGETLYLTIDSRLQKVAEQALGDNNGSVVAIDVTNGDLLAMVSKPSYNPNLFVNGIDSRSYGRLRDDRSRPLFNRALRGQYPPGSTVKPFFGLASLEMGVNTADRVMYAGPHYQLPGDTHRYRDWKKTGHGLVDMRKSIIQSCDVYFYDLAVRMGIDRMHDYMSAFGFGSKTEIDIGGEVSGLFPSREWKRRRKGVAWYPGETVITGIGQGYTLVTPLQLASATATLANNGKGFHPRLVQGIENPVSGELVAQPPRIRKPLDIQQQSHWDAVFDSMIGVIHAPNGTARRISRGIDFQIAGKTGTAQVFTVAQDEEYDEDEVARHLRDHALF
ncbi:MAG: penicillin-binding protein 2, partial [Gammaproteobacteria bacterium]